MRLLDYKDLKFSGIYLIKNKLNNKVYIGQSIYIAKRIKMHLLSVEQNDTAPIHLAISKEGINNFELEILEKCPIAELDAQEKYWINFFNSTNPEFDYNVSCGGSNTLYKIKNFSKYQLQELINLLIENKSTYAELSEKFHVSKSSIQRVNLGIVWHSSELNYPLRKLSDIHKHQYTGKCLLQLDLQDNLINKFTSISAAGRQLNLNHSVITKAANGSRKTAYKFKWKWEDCSEEDWLSLLNNELKE